MTDQVKKYRPERVFRSDAGGELYAPVRYINNVPHESGDTPSYSREAISKRCDELNARAGVPMGCKRHRWSDPIGVSKGYKRRNKAGHYAVHVTRRCRNCGEVRSKTEKTKSK